MTYASSTKPWALLVDDARRDVAFVRGGPASVIRACMQAAGVGAEDRAWSPDHEAWIFPRAARATLIRVMSQADVDLDVRRIGDAVIGEPDRREFAADDDTTNTEVDNAGDTETTP